MTDETNEKADAGESPSPYTRQSAEIETVLSSSVSLKTAVYMTPKGDLVVGVVRYVRGARKRAMYVPIAEAPAVADAMARLAREHGPGPT